jgi:hypothetical protein
MAKQTKPKSKRTQVKDLQVTQQELTTDEAAKVKGGAGDRRRIIDGYSAEFYAGTRIENAADVPPKVIKK